MPPLGQQQVFTYADHDSYASFSYNTKAITVLKLVPQCLAKSVTVYQVCVLAPLFPNHWCKPTHELKVASIQLGANGHWINKVLLIAVIAIVITLLKLPIVFKNWSHLKFPIILLLHNDQ